MASYNLVNGRPATVDPDQATLVRDWSDYPLMNVTDAWAPNNLTGSQKYFATQAEANAAIIKAGLDSFTTDDTNPANTVNAIKAALNINPNIKTVVVMFAQDDAFSKSETVTFQNAVTNTFKLNLATVQTFSTKDTDFTTQATAALNAQPDLIVISGLTSDGGNLVKQLRELGYKGLIVGGNGFNSSKLFAVCKAQCDGILIAQAYSPTADIPVNKDFRDAYKAQKQSEPPQLTAQMFACVQLFVDALSAMDKSSPIAGMDLGALRDALNKQVQGGTYTTPLGEVSFTAVPNGGAEINQKQFYVAQIKMNSDGNSGVFNFVQ